MYTILIATYIIIYFPQTWNTSKLPYKNCNKLKFSSLGKDSLHKLEIINTVYKIDCANTGCNARVSLISQV